MRLLTQNFLSCLKCESFPLALTAADIEVVAVAYDAEFTRRMLARLDYPILVAAFTAVVAAHGAALESHGTVTVAVPNATEDGGDQVEAEVVFYSKGDQLPESLEGADLSDASPVLRLLHFAQNMVAVRNGEVTCEACRQAYPVSDFIPNFVLESKN